MDHTYTMNPIREFVDRHDHHVNTAFDDFKVKHNKRYRGYKDHENRKDIFRQNVRYIHSKNRQGLTYTLAVNQMADMTNSEMATMRGRLRSKGYNGGAPFHYSNYELDSTPTSLDWRLYGAVTPVSHSLCSSPPAAEYALAEYASF